MRLSKKLAALAIAAGVAVTASAAFAYWTTGGSGSGSATGGADLNNLTIVASQDVAADRLIPEGSAVSLQLAVTNINDYSVALHGHDVSITADSLMCDTTPVPDSWFSLREDTISNNDVVGANSSATLAASGVTLEMNDDSTLNQDVCQGAAVTFSLSVN